LKAQLGLAESEFIQNTFPAKITERNINDDESADMKSFSDVDNKSDVSSDYLCLPRGCEPELCCELEELGVDIRIIDKTYSGKNIDVEFNGQLRDEQSLALEYLLHHDIGIIPKHKRIIGLFTIIFFLCSHLLGSLWIEMKKMYPSRNYMPNSWITILGISRLSKMS